MKKLLKTISILLVLAMLLAFAGCDTTPADPTDSKPAGSQPAGSDPAPSTPKDTEPADTDKFADIAGEYLLDGAGLGMPMKWYIKITADGKFQIATTRDFASPLKGEGTVGGKDGTYMFMYSDSTQEEPKTATFTMEGANLLFSTNIPIGTASLPATSAKLIACEDILGTYMGEYVKESAMAGTVTYSYELVLAYGMEYTFSSSFAMMGSTYTRVETGTFAVDGTAITFTATAVDGETADLPATATGTIADGTITAPFILSAMASAPQEVSAQLAIYADYAGAYTGVSELSMGGMMTLSFNTVLELDAFGGYTYTAYSADDDSVSVTQEGTYTVAEDGSFSFLSNAEGAEAVAGTLANYVMTTKFPISAMVSTPVEMNLYAEEVSGNFANTVTEGEKTYTATLELVGNTFVLTVGEDGAETPAYIAKGTFEIQKAMTTNVVLTTTALTGADGAAAEIPVELATVSCPVAESGINAELIFDLDDTAVVGFQMAKAE